MVYETEILTIDTDAAFNTAVEKASCRLRNGELVGMPTETVYGLAANAFDPVAVKKIFSVKNRPAHNPLIVHVASAKMAQSCIREWTPQMERLSEAFWPGPLTMVTWKSDLAPDIVTAGGPTVGIRWPWHPFFQKVIRQCGFPIAAPSANPANSLSPTSAEHVLEGLSGKIPLIVDGGFSAVGLESTVLDLTTQPPQILRPGMISATQLAEVLELETGALHSDECETGRKHPKSDSIKDWRGSVNPEGSEGVLPLKSPGQLSRHYSPKADLRIWKWNNAFEFDRLTDSLPYGAGTVHILFYDHAPSTERDWARVVCFPEDPEAYARALYAELHRADQMGAKCIILEEPPCETTWEAIRDRLKRAGKWEGLEEPDVHG